jgi:hypothetical protein
MIPRELPPMRTSMQPSLAAFVLIACVALPLGGLGAGETRRLSRKLPKVEIQLSGPTSVRPQDSLTMQSYKALLTNHSAEPLVLIVREGYLMDANWNWTVTDAKGFPVGMEFILRGYCGTVPYSAEAKAEASRLHDKDLVVLTPGESREFPIPAGPSDDYSFPSAGTYHLSVTLTYVQPNATEYFDEQGKRRAASGYAQWDLSQLNINSLHALQESLSVQATSKPWDLQLPSPRRARQ